MIGSISIGGGGGGGGGPPAPLATRMMSLIILEKEECKILTLLSMIPANWPSGDAFVSGVEGLRFKIWTGQIGLTVLPTARHRCNISSNRAVLLAGALSWAPQACCTLRRITVHRV